MKRLICIFLMTLVGITAAFSQMVTLTFTGRDADNHYIPFDRVEIGNVTRSWQETIYYPDTIIVMGGTGIEEDAFTKGFALAQNNPNPFEVITNATLTTSEAGEVTMEMLDMNGRMMASQRFAAIQAGAHRFVLTVAAPGTYILSARQNGKSSSIKMVNKGEGAINRIEYVGLSGNDAEMPEQKNESKGIITNPFTLGDEMVYIGYVNINGVEYTSQTIHKNQIVSENFILNFNATAPAGLATVTTDEVTDVQPTTATCGGNVVNDGGYSVIARGICWSTTPNPVFNDNHISNGDGLGAFTCQLANLSDGTTYYVRAYAVNSVGTAYGQQRSFTTSVTLPTVTTSYVSNITATTATCGGSVTDMGGTPVTSRGVCWSTSQNPTVNDSHTNDGGGMGDFTSNMTGLVFGTTYYVRAYATNSGGTAYGEQSCVTINPCPNAITVTDYDGNVYSTVQIGQQCWMRENLRTTHYANGESIPAGGNLESDNNPYYYDYSTSSIPLLQRGYLYNWPAVMHGANGSVTNPSGVEGICPTGWHVPSDAEWTQLTDYVSSQSQYVCGSNSTDIAKALAASEGWSTSTGSNTCAVGTSPNTNNTTGFSAVPAGENSFPTGAKSFVSSGWSTYFWSSSLEIYYNYTVYARRIEYNNSQVIREYRQPKNGYSVRCLCNASGMPTVTTNNNVNNINATTATCGGCVLDMGGTLVTSRGVCWSTSQNPTVNDSHTTDGSGMGNFTSNMTGLVFGTTYYVRAYATNSGGTVYGEQLCFTKNNDSLPCLSVATVTDYDGNVYNTVQIGNQCWMRENLRTTHYSNGASIPNGENSSSGISNLYYSETNPYYYDFDYLLQNSSSTPTPLSQRGLLYNWAAVMHGTSSSSSNPSGVQGICPTGWHVPSDAEWMQLFNYVFSHSRYLCGTANNSIAKALSFSTGWNTCFGTTCAVGDNLSANNATGFSAVPAGFASGDDFYFGFYSGGDIASFWSAAQNSSGNAYGIFLNYNSAYVSAGYDYKNCGHSVRCLKD